MRLWPEHPGRCGSGGSGGKASHFCLWFPTAEGCGTRGSGRSHTLVRRQVLPPLPGEPPPDSQELRTQYEHSRDGLSASGTIRSCAASVCPWHRCNQTGWACGGRHCAPGRAQLPLSHLSFHHAAATTGSFQGSLQAGLGCLCLAPLLPALPVLQEQTGRVSCRQQSVSGDRTGLDVPPDRCSAVACGSPKGRALLAYWVISQRGAEGRRCTPRSHCTDGAAPGRYLLLALDAMGRCL